MESKCSDFMSLANLNKINIHAGLKNHLGTEPVIFVVPITMHYTEGQGIFLKNKKKKT